MAAPCPMLPVGSRGSRHPPHRARQQLCPRPPTLPPWHTLPSSPPSLGSEHSIQHCQAPPCLGTTSHRPALRTLPSPPSLSLPWVLEHRRQGC